MSSEVEICNMALSHIGEESTVLSIYPPEGSIHAELCAKFYPIARDGLLSMHRWSFATKRIALARVESSIKQWAYAYAIPSDMMTAISIINNDSTSDYGSTTVQETQDFVIETDETGAMIILTNTDNAMLRYQSLVNDSNKFSPLFVQALSWNLAGLLAGPIIKGDAGQAEAKRCTQLMGSMLIAATSVDSNQRQITIKHKAPWLAHRG